ncbi:MAG: hypothetical protein J6A16_10330 [Oscillospiraceae bacterium]|nr:hypothetical protein [Oscillospiraceae bacterium]MBQ5334192.1 hypothetical protein [Oscillospiraceae bacterium]
MKFKDYHPHIEVISNMAEKASDPKCYPYLLQRELAHDRIFTRYCMERELTPKEIDMIVDKVIQRLSVRADTKQAIQQIESLNKAITDLTTIGGQK